MSRLLSSLQHARAQMRSALLNSKLAPLNLLRDLASQLENDSACIESAAFPDAWPRIVAWLKGSDHSSALSKDDWKAAPFYLFRDVEGKPLLRHPRMKLGMGTAFAVLRSTWLIRAVTAYC